MAVTLVIYDVFLLARPSNLQKRGRLRRPRLSRRLTQQTAPKLASCLAEILSATLISLVLGSGSIHVYGIAWLALCLCSTACKFFCRPRSPSRSSLAGPPKGDRRSLSFRTLKQNACTKHAQRARRSSLPGPLLACCERTAHRCGLPAVLKSSFG